MDNKCLLTVFTPAYNRAHTLPRTYASLCKQDCKDFIWLIIDDGSTDHTSSLVKDWQSGTCEFEIQYIYKENGGMHTAHNLAYEVIVTELSVCIDSDDCLADGAVTKILHKWHQIEHQNYAGMIGLDTDLSGNIIGTRFPPDMSETTLSGYYAAGGTGDKKLVYRTQIIREYPPYPTFESEKYVGLVYKYLLIDQDYKLAVLNDVLCNVEYQADGSSATMWKQYRRNPKGFAFLRAVYLNYDSSPKRAFMNAIHYVSSSVISKNKRFLLQSPHKGLTFLALPFGIAFAVLTIIKGR